MDLLKIKQMIENGFTLAKIRLIYLLNKKRFKTSSSSK
jgi:hypothetical protein